MSNATDVLTASEVAQIERVNVQTVRHWLVSGELIGYKLGKGRRSEWRVKREELERFRQPAHSSNEEENQHG